MGRIRVSGSFCKAFDERSSTDNLPESTVRLECPPTQMSGDNPHHPNPQQATTTALHPTTTPPARPSNDLPTPLVNTPPHLPTAMSPIFCQVADVAVLCEFNAHPGTLSALDSTKASGYQNSLRRPAPPCAPVRARVKPGQSLSSRLSHAHRKISLPYCSA